MLLALLVAAALMLLTTYLHRTTYMAGAALESVRLADQARIDLLMHERARDPLVRHRLERDLQNGLSEAGRYSSDEHEERLVAQALAAVNAYLQASAAPRPAYREVEVAFSRLHALVSLNLEQASAALARADRWNTIADVIGVSATALLLMVGGALMLWLRRVAFKPLFALFEVMRRFAGGHRDVRAAETGHLELREISRRFNEMADALAANRHAQLAFLGGVAHDLRNPLWALRLTVQALDVSALESDPEQLRQALGSLNDQISRVERMVGDLLDAARIEAGELKLTVERADACSIVQHVLQLLAGALSKHRLHVRLPQHAVWFQCDALRIEQVLTNLVSNAVKYSPEGALIEVALEPQPHEVVFRVTDQGVGISDEDQKRIFEPFQRAGLTTNVPGAGLGLFVIRRIVEQHGGHIELESAPGRGSTFRAVLPV
jgi:signal transduction histidine kinase